MHITEHLWADLLVRQAGVVSRTQAIACGWNGRAIEHRLAGRWQRLLPGVYLTVTGTPTQEQRHWAGILYAGPEAALTSWSGLERWELADARDDVHVALPHRRRLKAPEFLLGQGAVVLHRTTRPVLPRGSVPALPVERCVVDACLDLSLLNEVRAIASSSVQRRRTTVERLRAELEAAPQQGSGLLRRALDEVGEGARSAPEAALARALRRQQLPAYRLNAEVRDAAGTRLALGDLVIDEVMLLVEVDGERWHLTAEQWVDDVERHTRLEAAGWTVLRYPASLVLRDPDSVAREIAQVAARLMVRASSGPSAA